MPRVHNERGETFDFLHRLQAIIVRQSTGVHLRLVREGQTFGFFFVRRAFASVFLYSPVVQKRV